MTVEPSFMPIYSAALFKKEGDEKPVETFPLIADSERGAVEELRDWMAAAWLPGPRKGKRARPIMGKVLKTARGQTEEVRRLRWTISGVVDVAPARMTMNR